MTTKASSSGRTKRWNDDFQIFQLALRIDAKLREAQEAASQLMHMMMERRQAAEDEGVPETPRPPTTPPADPERPGQYATVIRPAITPDVFLENMRRLFKAAPHEKARAQVVDSVRHGVETGIITAEQAATIGRDAP